MKYFDLLQSFIERSEGAASVDELAAIFRASIAGLGFRYFNCCSHVDPLRPPRLAVVLHNYPAPWVLSYSERQLYYVDPVFRYAEKTLLPFFWDSNDFRTMLSRQQREILAEAAEYAIVHGYTIPIHLPNSRGDFRASCSVVPDALSIELPSYQTVQLMAYYMYQAASRDADARSAVVATSDLSIRERQCLEFVAQGKSDWVVGKLLGISERTVHNHIERAKRRLGVATRVQAIVHSLSSRQISFGDVIRADASLQHAADQRHTK